MYIHLIHIYIYSRGSTYGISFAKMFLQSQPSIEVNIPWTIYIHGSYGLGESILELEKVMQLT